MSGAGSGIQQTASNVGQQATNFMQGGQAASAGQMSAALNQPSQQAQMLAQQNAGLTGPSQQAQMLAQQNAGMNLTPQQSVQQVASSMPNAPASANVDLSKTANFSFKDITNALQNPEAVGALSDAAEEQQQQQQQQQAPLGQPQKFNMESYNQAIGGMQPGGSNAMKMIQGFQNQNMGGGQPNIKDALMKALQGK